MDLLIRHTHGVVEASVRRAFGPLGHMPAGQFGLVELAAAFGRPALYGRRSVGHRGILIHCIFAAGRIISGDADA